jgi:hypothetical protein
MRHCNRQCTGYHTHPSCSSLSNAVAVRPSSVNATSTGASTAAAELDAEAAVSSIVLKFCVEVPPRRLVFMRLFEHQALGLAQGLDGEPFARSEKRCSFFPRDS